MNFKRMGCMLVGSMMLAASYGYAHHHTTGTTTAKAQWQAFCQSKNAKIQHTVNVLVKNYGKGEKCAAAFATLASVTEFDLARKGIETIVPVVIFTKVQKLDLFGNSIAVIPAGIGNMTQLQELNLAQNDKLKRVPATVGNLTNLRTLDLSATSVVRLPAEIGNLTKLEELDVSYNDDLEAVPEAIGMCTNLRMLYVMATEISQLPSEIGNLTNLEELHLWRNRKLKTLPTTIGNLKNLKVLGIQRTAMNNGYTIPQGLAKLQKVYVSKDVAVRIPASLEGKVKVIQE